MANKLTYYVRIDKDNDSDRAVFEIDDKAPGDYRYGNGMLTLQVTRFLSNPDQWFGFKYALETNQIDGLQRASKIARRIFPRKYWYTHDKFSLSPDAILARLHEIKAVEVVYDNRENKFMPIDETEPPEAVVWKDDKEALGRNSYEVSVVAVTEKEARIKIIAELGKRYDSKFLLEWISAGQPIVNYSEKVPYDNKAPDVRPAEVRLFAEKKVEDEVLASN